MCEKCKDNHKDIGFRCPCECHTVWYGENLDDDEEK